MGVRFYDEALVNKIGAWVKDPNMTILKPDETTRLFEMNLDNKKDSDIKLPIIALSRNKTVDILNMEKQYKTFNGAVLSSDIEKTIQLNVIPISIAYQLDVYTKGIVEADEYIRNFVFNFINYPKIIVKLPYGNYQIEHESTIHLEPIISDNSDIREHLFPDQFTRYSLTFTIDDAYLFSIPTTISSTLEESQLNVKNFSANTFDQEKITS